MDAYSRETAAILAQAAEIRRRRIELFATLARLDAATDDIEAEAHVRGALARPSLDQDNERPAS